MTSATLGAARVSGPTSFVVEGYVGGVRCLIMFDNGASTCFGDEDWMQRHGMQFEQLDDPLLVETANSQKIPVATEALSELCIESVRTPVRLKPMKNMLKGVQVILGMDWLHKYDVDIKCGQMKAKLKVLGKKHVLKALPYTDSESIGPGCAALKALHTEPVNK